MVGCGNWGEGEEASKMTTSFLSGATGEMMKLFTEMGTCLRKEQFEGRRENLGVQFERNLKKAGHVGLDFEIDLESISI